MFTIANGIILKGHDLVASRENIVVDDGKIIEIAKDAKEGKIIPAVEVHHKIPISQGGAHARENLMSLCRSCHTKIHHEIGDR